MSAGLALLHLRQLQKRLKDCGDAVQLGTRAGQRFGKVSARGFGPVQIVEMDGDTLNRGLQVMRDIERDLPQRRDRGFLRPSHLVHRLADAQQVIRPARPRRDPCGQVPCRQPV